MFRVGLRLVKTSEVVGRGEGRGKGKVLGNCLSHWGEGEMLVSYLFLRPVDGFFIYFFYLLCTT